MKVHVGVEWRGRNQLHWENACMTLRAHEGVWTLSWEQWNTSTGFYPKLGDMSVGNTGSQGYVLGGHWSHKAERNAYSTGEVPVEMDGP